MNLTADKTIITNLGYTETNSIIEIFNKVLIKSGKKVKLESKSLTPIVWNVILKNRARVFVNFKIYINGPDNFTLKIQVFPKNLDKKIAEMVNAVIEKRNKRN